MFVNSDDIESVCPDVHVRAQVRPHRPSLYSCITAFFCHRLIVYTTHCNGSEQPALKLLAAQ